MGVGQRFIFFYASYDSLEVHHFFSDMFLKFWELETSPEKLFSWRINPKTVMIPDEKSLGRRWTRRESCEIIPGMAYFRRFLG